jgi:hypothetical protein
MNAPAALSVRAQEPPGFGLHARSCLAIWARHTTQTVDRHSSQASGATPEAHRTLLPAGPGASPSGSAASRSTRTARSHVGRARCASSPLRRPIRSRRRAAATGATSSASSTMQAMTAQPEAARQPLVPVARPPPLMRAASPPQRGDTRARRACPTVSQRSAIATGGSRSRPLAAPAFAGPSEPRAIGDGTAGAGVGAPASPLAPRPP